MLNSIPKSVIVISSHVVRGSVGNRAVVFSLEVLGHPVWATQTVTLPWHPGHGPSSRIVPSAEQFEQLLDDLSNAPWLSEVGAVLSGYLGHASQTKSVAKLVHAVKAQSPNAIYLCDPVIGDEGGLYVPDKTANAIRDDLIPISDITTPNRFELAWLSDQILKTNDDILSSASILKPHLVLVTSAFATAKLSIANLLITPDGYHIAEHPLLNGALINGTGDLTSALILAHLMDGAAHDQALQSATASVYEIMVRTVQSKRNELLLSRSQFSILAPEIDIQMRSVIRE